MKWKIGRWERGTALVFSLIFIAALGLIGVASVRSSMTELNMASNGEEDMNAFETAQSAIDFMAANPVLLPTSGPLDVPVNVPLPAAPAVQAFTTVTGETVTALATRVQDCVPPPRVRNGSSLLSFSAFTYRLASDVDKTATGKGKNSLRQGQIVLGPKC